METSASTTFPLLVTSMLEDLWSICPSKWRTYCVLRLSTMVSAAGTELRTWSGRAPAGTHAIAVTVTKSKPRKRCVIVFLALLLTLLTKPARGLKWFGDDQGDDPLHGHD